MLIQAHWAGFYYAFGLDQEQMLLEFVAPEEVIKDLMGPNLAPGKTSASPDERERIFGWKTTDSEGVVRGMESAPRWFTPGDSKQYRIGFLAGQTAVVQFTSQPSRYKMVIYDSGSGYIFVDLVASRVYVTQTRGKLF